MKTSAWKVKSNKYVGMTHRKVLEECVKTKYSKWPPKAVYKS